MGRTAKQILEDAAAERAANATGKPNLPDLTQKPAGTSIDPSVSPDVPWDKVLSTAWENAKSAFAPSNLINGALAIPGVIEEAAVGPLASISDPTGYAMKQAKRGDSIIRNVYDEAVHPVNHFAAHPISMFADLLALKGAGAPVKAAESMPLARVIEGAKQAKDANYERFTSIPPTVPAGDLVDKMTAAADQAGYAGRGTPGGTAYTGVHDTMDAVKKWRGAGDLSGQDLDTLRAEASRVDKRISNEPGRDDIIAQSMRQALENHLEENFPAIHERLRTALDMNKDYKNASDLATVVDQGAAKAAASGNPVKATNNGILKLLTDKNASKYMEEDYGQKLKDNIQTPQEAPPSKWSQLNSTFRSLGTGALGGYLSGHPAIGILAGIAAPTALATAQHLRRGLQAEKLINAVDDLARTTAGAPAKAQKTAAMKLNKLARGAGIMSILSKSDQ